MTIYNLSELNGNYSILYQTKAPELDFVWYDHTNATAELVDGVLLGSDAGGASWHATFELDNNNQVNFIANVTTEKAPPTTFVLDKSGYPTRIKQQYTGTLRVNVIEENIVMTGTVVHGVVKITVQLRRM